MMGIKNIKCYTKNCESQNVKRFNFICEHMLCEECYKYHSTCNNSKKVKIIPENIDKEKNVNNMYSVSGTSTNMISNRISYSMNLMGPSMTIMTACSSSIHALNVCINSIMNDECYAGFVGGVTYNTLDEKKLKHLLKNLNLGYSYGRALNVDLRNNLVDTSSYDKDNGKGKFAEIVNQLRGVEIVEK